ncbi:MAG: DUF1501 domain-containing protein [Gemmataceae bacterium]|jgi:hypothetical protein|uniref:DUF1501 domain-containing protein n=1 Tax=Thermogemmata fonticola TaxID=2755323 RepID=A0A7V8VB00_9BACT|nr:DUF1501 domain-containing protein [Thermogemmata fonticola]MBA2224735.1 DUF1501 domain-containing protein [Thermogemmata fonticola]MCX8140569.1 DUF1501 domain-containing protein [Gemmataceae bacterium]
MLTVPRYFVSPLGAYSSRREFLRRAGGGFGLLALADLLHAEQARSVNPLAPKKPHFPAKAKAVIWLFMNGGPSHVDTWDYKPELEKRDGQELPGFDPNTGFFNQQVGPLMKSPFRWKQHGQCGKWVSELFPHLSRHVDKMAFIHSLWTDSNNHAPALFKMNSGMSRMGFPCVGSWVTYGLGSESQDLPAFCVMYDTLGRGIPKGHSLNWGAGFLPSIYQGTAFKPQGQPIDNLERPADLSPQRQRQQLDLLGRLNRLHTREVDDPEFSARMETFELAYRMQMAAPEALDLSRETEETRRLYGLDHPKAGHFARQCLIARRLVERGVRFVQIYSGGMENDLSWDGHNNIAKNHSGFAAETDQPIAALLTDLERRGLLSQTLVIWGGEFGRLPIVQKGSGGRDHNPHAMTYWLAGGGIRGGVSYGATDDIGFKAVENRVSVHDLHATILHLLGLDHKKLTYRYNGRDFRLTDVYGSVIEPILA